MYSFDRGFFERMVERKQENKVVSESQSFFAYFLLLLLLQYKHKFSKNYSYFSSVLTLPLDGFVDQRLQSN